MKTVTRNTQSAKDAPKVETNAPAAVEVKVKPESKPAPKSKKSAVKKDAPKSEVKAKVEASKAEAKVEIPAPLKINQKIFDEKIAKLEKRLENDKAQFTDKPVHIGYGYFVTKRKAGLLVLEYHKGLRPGEWLLRDRSGKVLSEPTKTMWELNQFANKNF